jgi:hypothetical protein
MNTQERQTIREEWNRDFNRFRNLILNCERLYMWHGTTADNSLTYQLQYDGSTERFILSVISRVDNVNSVLHQILVDDRLLRDIYTYQRFLNTGRLIDYRYRIAIGDHIETPVHITNSERSRTLRTLECFRPSRRYLIWNSNNSVNTVRFLIYRDYHNNCLLLISQFALFDNEEGWIWITDSSQNIRDFNWSQNIGRFSGLLNSMMNLQHILNHGSWHSVITDRIDFISMDEYDSRSDDYY